MKELLRILLSDASKADAFYARSLMIYAKSCDSGNAEACDRMGDAYDDGHVFAQDQTKAMIFYTKAYDGGYSSSCEALGAHYDSGQGTRKDPEKAAIYYKKLLDIYNKECEKGNGESYLQLASDYDTPAKVIHVIKYSKEKTFSYYMKSCDAGKIDGCMYTGYAYYFGNGVAVDNVKALEYYIRACDGGNYFGCTQAGDVYDGGVGVPADKEKAKYFYGRAEEIIK